MHIDKKNKLVSAVVPIYNEEKSIENVIRLLLECKLIDEVICINDGSSDSSIQVLNEFRRRITLINLTRNHGKGFALAAGTKLAHGDIVLFIDSDLENLSDKHIIQLLAPLFHETYKSVVGVRSFEKANYYIPLRFNIAGERAYHKEFLLPYLQRMRKTRYGVEVFLNSLFTKEETKVLILEGLYNPPKHKKRELEEAIKEYMRESIEIAIELARIEGKPIEDSWRIMRSLRIKNISELLELADNITNKYASLFFRRYFVKYMKDVRKFLEIGRIKIKNRKN